MIVYVYPFRGVCRDHSCHHAVTTKMASMAIFTFDNLVYTGYLHRVMGLFLYLATHVLLYNYSTSYDSSKGILIM